MRHVGHENLGPIYDFSNGFSVLSWFILCDLSPGTCRRKRPTHTPSMKLLKGAHSRGVGGPLLLCVFLAHDGKCGMRHVGHENRSPTLDFSNGFSVLSWFFVWLEPMHLQASASHPHPVHETH